MGEVNIIPIKVIPISIERLETDVVKIRKGEAKLPSLRIEKQNFWELLYEGGGRWMWDYISDNTSDPIWIPQACKQGTIIMATDESYDRQ